MNYLHRLRAAVGPRKILLVYASAVVRDADGRVLLQHRADFREAWWGLPGGLLEPGETIGQCARREVAEETGLIVEPARLSGVYSSPRYDVRYPNGDEVQQVTACFDCRIVGGSLRPDGGETLDCRFFPPDDLPPRPAWYADMIAHALTGGPEAYVDPTEFNSSPAGAGPLVDYVRWLRLSLGHAPLVHPGAAAVVRDERGRVLFVKRRDFGRWGLPAGAMNLGETLSAAAVRETREETGLEVAPIRLIALASGRRTTYPNGDQLDVFGGWFECRVVGGTLTPDGVETLDVGYFPLDRLPPLMPNLEDRLASAVSQSGKVFFE